MNRIVIVGASAGGLAVAEALRRKGYGGVITLVGDEAEHPYDRPPLSKQLLSGQWEPDRLALRSQTDLDALDLDMHLGTAAAGLSVDSSEVLLADGSRLHYDGLVIATGVRPRRLPGCEDLSGVHVLRTLQDALTLRSRLCDGGQLVIVGAGFVGAEVAATARGLGVGVTMLEAAAVPLSAAIGEEAGQFLARLHRDNGVDIRTSASVADVVGERGRVTGVNMADTSFLPADDLLVAVGSLPNTEWLDGNGLTVDNGLVCDEFGAAAPGVYAVGDVARWNNPLFGTAIRVEHRTNAAEQGMTVAHNLLNPADQWSLATVPYFWSDQYDTKIQAFGHLSAHDEALVVQDDNDQSTRSILVAYRKENRLAGVLAAAKSPKVLRAWRSLVVAGADWSEALSDQALA